MSDDEIDQLYAGAPEAFTALRAELVTAAKKRGDGEAAKRIGAARRPTTAAWVVNSVVRSDATARDRLTALGDELRAAHASMDGVRIRELSTVQRTLVDGLARSGFAAAGVAQPSAALRDDVVGTLQAAIADPDVAARLGWLGVAERWSGFGDFGTVSAVGVAEARKPTPAESVEPEPVGPTEDEVAAARDRVLAARGDAEEAERGHADAIDALSERESRLVTARRRYEKLLEKLAAAEQDLSAADTEHAAAEQVAHRAADLVGQAQSRLSEAEADQTVLGDAGT